MNLDLLKYDFNAIADIEDKLGKPIGALFSGDGLGFNSLRLLVWGGMKANQPGLTIPAAGLMIQTYSLHGGDMEKLGSRIVEEIEKSGLFENFTKAGE